MIHILKSGKPKGLAAFYSLIIQFKYDDVYNIGIRHLYISDFIIKPQTRSRI